jgi:hypothetical protein
MKRTIDRPVIATACAALLLLSPPSSARNGVAVTLPDKRVAVLSQGDLEGPSIGSYSVAVFQEPELTRFVAGAVFPRDGSIFLPDGKPRVKFADVTGDGKPEMIISKQSAGSGNQVEVDALRIDETSVSLVVRVRTDARNDELTELRAACRRRANSERYRERSREC